MVNEDQVKIERDYLERIGELENQIEGLANLVFVQQKAINSLQSATLKLSEDLDATLSQVVENRGALIEISKKLSRN